MDKLNSFLQRVVPIIVVAMFVSCADDSTSSKKIDLKDPNEVQNTALNDPDSASKATKGMFDVSNDIGGAKTQGEADSATITTVGAGALRTLKMAKDTTKNSTAKAAVSSLYSLLSDVSTSIMANNTVNRVATSSRIMTKVEDVTMACESGSGIVTIDAGEIDPVSYQLTTKFTINASKCRQGSEEFNGIVESEYATVFDYSELNTDPQNFDSFKQELTGTLVAGDGNGTASLADDFSVVRYEGDTVVSTTVISLDSTFTMMTDMDVSGTGFDPLAPNGSFVQSQLDFEGTGEITKDIVGEDNESILLDQLKVSMTATVGGTDGGYDAGAKLGFDGAMEKTKGENKEYLGFVAFSLEANVVADGTTEAIKGKVVIEHTPPQCQDGSYEFDTTVAFKTTTLDGLTEGNMTVNGATIAVSDTTPNLLTVTVGGEEKDVTKDDIDNICNI